VTLVERTAIAREERLPSYRAPFLAALLTIGSLVAAGAGWGMYARLDSAVTTQGVLLAESRRKTVEHFEGGILERLLVAPGDRVREGDVVALLDATQPRELHGQLEAERIAIAFDLWRLDAELAETPPDLAAAPAAPEAERDLQIELQLRRFEARRLAHEATLEALHRRVAELEANVAASAARRDAAGRQLALWREERDSTARLAASGAAPRLRLLELDRAAAALEGERDQNEGLVTAAREEIARTRSQIASVVQERRAEIAERKAEARRQLVGLDSRLRAAGDVLERHRLRAPQDGLVVDVATVTPGAIIATGMPLMEIVPDRDALVVQARVPPEAIDTVFPGRTAQIRFVAYKRAVAPVVDGTVTFVSPDLLEDPRDGTPFFDLRVTLDPASLAKSPEVEPTPGMPVEVVIKTGERRAGDYMLEPILRHLRRAFREE
jgi:HlyD family secretion protein